MVSQHGDTDGLLARIARGDDRAIDELFGRFRPRLSRLVGVRMDKRLVARIDPSDVVQEAITEAARRLPAYLDARPVPFHVWLRQIAFDRLVHLHRHHLRAQRRSTAREEAIELSLPDESVLDLTRQLAVQGTDPAGRLIRQELEQRMQTALLGLAESDREILVLRFLEHLSVVEAGEVLGISASAVKMRQARALQRLHELMAGGMEDSET